VKQPQNPSQQAGLLQATGLPHGPSGSYQAKCHTGLGRPSPPP